MATNKKISELTELTSPASDDYLAIVDTSAGETKKIKRSNLIATLSDLGITASTDDLNILDGASSEGLTHTELMYLNGVTSNIQTQLDGKVPTTRQITAGTGLSGGGTLDSDITLSLNANLDDLGDTSITTPSAGHYLRYDGTNWVNSALQAGDLPSHTHSGDDITSGTVGAAYGGTGIDTSSFTGIPKISSGTWSVGAELNDLSDTSISSPADGEVLTYNGTSGKWENQPASGGGASQLSDLSDVGTVSYTAGYVLKADGTDYDSGYLNLGELGDTSISSPASGQYLRHDGTNWANSTIQKADLPTINLDDLGDVNASSPSDGQVLTWDSGTSNWIASTPSGGGAWALVSHSTFTSDNYSITGLDGDTDKIYKLVIRAEYTTDRFPLQLRFNSDTGTNYAYTLRYTGNNNGADLNSYTTSVSFDSSYMWLRGLNNMNSYLVEILIWAKSGRYRMIRFKTVGEGGTNYWELVDGAGWWNNTTSNLTSIQIYCSAGYSISGEYWLYKISS